MALTINEILKDSKVSKNAKGYETERTFIVLGTDSDSCIDVLADAGIPQTGATHPDYSAMKVVNVVCTQIMEHENADNQLAFKVVASYSSAFSAIQRATVPLSRDADYSYSGTTEVDEIYIDYSSTPKLVQNSAGDKFENQPQGLKPAQVVTITRNEATYSAGTYYSYIGSLNSNTITINGESFTAAKCRMDSISATYETEVINGTTYNYWQVTYVIALNPNTWRSVVYDTGYNKLVSGKKRPIEDGTGLAVQTPWPLDGTGAPKTNATDTPATITFKIYPEVSWSFGF